MGNRTLALAMLFFLLVAAIAASAAELKSDYKKGQQQTGERIVPPRPVPPARNPFADLVGQCRVLDGHHYRGLTVFPVEAPAYGIGMVPLTLDEAVAQNAIVVMEKGAGQVPVLIVENRSAQFVFILSGEILVGGKQNRILREDVLLPPHSGPIDLPAYCVEQGRWVKNADGFRSDGNLASTKIRVHAQKDAPQESVWGGIADTAKALRQESRTGDFNEVFKGGEVAGRLSAYREEFCKVMPRRIVGMVVARNGRFVGADLFGDTSLFFKLRSKVLDSYAMDVLMEDRRMPVVPGRDAAEQFLRMVLAAPYYTQATPGAGVIGRAVGNGIDAKGLVWSDRVVHVSMFPAVTIMRQ